MVKSKERIFSSYQEAGISTDASVSAIALEAGSLEANSSLTLPSVFTLPRSVFMDMVDPKNYELLMEKGGVNSIARLLFVNLEKGLSVDDRTPSLSDRESFYGKNVVPSLPSKSFFALMWEAFQDKTLILLSIASVVSLAIGIYQDVRETDPLKPKIGWIEGFAILVAVVIVVLVNSINDYQKEKQFKKLNAKKEDREVKVLRNGKNEMISIYDVQVGEICILEPGEVPPADGIIFESHNLNCDESGATGESDAIKKSLDKDPFILSGTKVLEGVGKMIVIAVGPYSFNGKTMMSLQVEVTETPLEIKLDHLAESIAKLGAAAAVLMFFTLLIKYLIIASLNGDFQPPVNAANIVTRITSILIQAITVVVVAVPEGLPMAVTLALAFATTRMLKDNNLVRVLSACETMGNATTICSDKTGTLTENKMTVVQGEVAGIWFDNDFKIKEMVSAISSKILHLLTEGISVNSSAFESVDPKTGILVATGSKTEVALLNFIRKLGSDFNKIRNSVEVVNLYPFSSQRKSMTTIVKTSVLSEGTSKTSSSGYRLYCKGASEIVLSFCSEYFGADGQIYPIDRKFSEKMNRTIAQLASESLRTISIAYKEYDSDEYHNIKGGEQPPDAGYVFISIVGIEDPLRDGVPEAVSTCQKAGIFVRMVTGDNILTAQSIAKKCGILHKGGVIMEGPKFRTLSDEALTQVIPKLQVLARSSPLDKQILVGKLRDMGEVVAVTGDGTNDGPALKAADVGFSMGIAGTEVAKEASSIILMDDNFSSIVKAVGWGRCVNDSVRKFLQFQLTVNITAVIVTFVSACIDDKEHSVLTAVQLLWVNLIMDTLAALALATEKPSPELLDRHPEPKNGSLITFRMWKMIIGQAVFQIIVSLVMFQLGAKILQLPDTELGIDTLRTFVFNTFVFMQLFNEINCRFLDDQLFVFKGIHRNPVFLSIFVVTVFAQTLIVSFGGVAFSTVQLSWWQWLISIGIAALGLPVAIIIRLIPNFEWMSRRREPERIFVSKERLQWQSAINNVKQELSVFSALRRAKRQPTLRSVLTSQSAITNATGNTYNL